jgi:hypothetical protein
MVAAHFAELVIGRLGPLTARRANHPPACPALPIKIFRFTFHPNQLYIASHPAPA